MGGLIRIPPHSYQNPCLALKKSVYYIILALLTVQTTSSQVWLTGKVYDSTRMVSIPFVKVTSKKGLVTYTDSIGRYGLSIDKQDSISFTYKGKSTSFFPVSTIRYPAGFDISLQVTVQDRYQTLKEVVVIAKSYRQDSAENRERYSKIFGFESGGSKSRNQATSTPTASSACSNSEETKRCGASATG